MTTVIAPAGLVKDLTALVKGVVTNDGAALSEVSTDFGRMITRRPAVVVRPQSTADVVAVIQYARAHAIPVATRAGAHTQSGQALTEGGILLDMRTLNRIGALDAAGLTITAEAGVVWKDLVAHTLAGGLIPRVLTNNLNVTVGGTLSVAGLGIASFKYGAQVDNIVELEAVLGTGEVVTCSETVNTDTFNVLRSGLGQCGIITRATIRLRDCHPLTRTYFLLYDDLATFVKDAEIVMWQQRCDYLESWCVPAAIGFRGSGETREPFAAWFYPMHITVEFDPAEREPNKELILAGLSPYKDITQQDLSIAEFSNRLERLFTIWRNMGYWDRPHPWMETVLPWEYAPEFIETVLAQTPPHAMGGGHILLWPCRNDVSHAPLFMRPPDSDFTMGWGLLPGVPPEFLDLALPRLDLASDMSEAVGGKRYLSGYVRFNTVQKWEAHFGPEKWAWYKGMKAQCDPDRILNPGFIVWE